MSDLTRYEIDGMKDEMYACSHGEWFKAEEAEARIGELVMAGSMVEAKLKDAEARFKQLEARLKAADELADAVEEADAVYGNFERELVAYREASK